MIGKKILGLALTASLVASSLYAEQKVDKLTMQVKKELMNISFIRNGKFKIKKVRDLGDIYAIYGSHPRMPQLTMFITKDKKTIVIGAGFTPEGKKIEFLTDVSKYKKDAVYTVGNGSKEYILFTDPECPYCQRLEKKLDTLNKDVKLHVLLFPLSFHKNAIAMSKYILSKKSNDDRAKAMKDIANGNTDYAKAKYSDKENTEYMAIIEKNKKIAREVGVNGTPTVYSLKGRKINWPDLLSKKGL